MSDVVWLADWFRQHCDGNWEHEYGITIGTLDNPGWSLRVELTGTELEETAFDEESVESENGWVRYWKDPKEKVFNAAGAPECLPAMIARFRSWAAR